MSLTTRLHKSDVYSTRAREEENSPNIVGIIVFTIIIVLIIITTNMKTTMIHTYLYLKCILHLFVGKSVEYCKYSKKQTSYVLNFKWDRVRGMRAF